MYSKESHISVVIPAYNEEQAIAKVISEVPSLVNEIIVVSNGSTDDTSKVAIEAGATVIEEPIMGYGQACLTGIAHALIDAEILVFLDGDYSDYPVEMTNLLIPIFDGDAEMVIGSRALGRKSKGAMMPQQIFCNWLATSLIKLFYNHSYTDLGPFRAITKDAYQSLGMVDTNYGWTVEMQVKGLKKGLKILEVPVNYRLRIVTSKVSGTVKGTIMAGCKIILTIFKYL